MTWTKQHIEKLKAEGKIRDFNEAVMKRDAPATGGRKVVKHFEKRSKEKDYIGWNLLYWSNLHCVGLEEEFKFSPDRGFKSDWAIPSLKILIEYEGLFSEKSGHRTISGVSRDVEKYNLAQAMGYRVLRLTAMNYKTLISELNKLL